jgi:hypothetical protein
MRSFSNMPVPLGAVIALVLVTGCASQPDFGEALEARSAGASALSENYKKGEKLVASGQANIAKGRKLVRKGESRIDDGEAAVRRGEELMATARDGYCQDVGYQAPECR